MSFPICTPFEDGVCPGCEYRSPEDRCMVHVDGYNYAKCAEVRNCVMHHPKTEKAKR